MALNLAADALVAVISSAANSAMEAPAGPPTIPGSRAATGIELRLSRVFIKDNHTAHVGPFPGRATLYLLVIVADSRSATPTVLPITGFSGINDQQDLLVDRTIFYWQPAATNEAAPTQIHVLVSVLKSKQHLRDTGTVLAQAQASAPYQSLATQLAAAIAAPAQAATLLLQLGSVVGSLLTDVEDRTLLTQVTSFTNLNGDFDTLGKTAHNQENQYAATTLTLIVRDASQNPAPPVAAS